MQADRIPLFPLNVVLLPGEQLPLHIFELRYRQMVRECLDEQTFFGLLLALPNGVVRVGCTAEILEVIKTYEDGRMDIITVGREPFRVLELDTKEPLLHGEVDYLEEYDLAPDSAKQNQLIELYETCHTLLYSSLPKCLERLPEERLSYTIASTLPLELLCKQQILELRSETDRQERLMTYLREWAPHLQKNEVLRHRAGGNGRGLN
ncbi:MAG TPA: LON peptidase substrate-binding domain-containing protein [Candidatus Acidoferrum sp.]|jgi:ATP-dependent Lon protease